MSPTAPALSIILPLTGDAASVAETLAALAASDLPRRRWELVVVMPATAHEILTIAAQHADAIVRIGRSWSRGSAYLCNRGAEVARGDVLVFVNQDVLVAPDTLRRIDTAFEEFGLSALVGSLNSTPADASIPMRYQALIRDWTSRRGAGVTEHFSIACGAIRRTAFIAAGRLDEWQQPPLGCAGSELGLRLRALGHRIELRNDVQMTSRRRVSWLEATRPLTIESSPPPWMPGGASSGTRTRTLRIHERHVSAALWAALALAAAAIAAQSRTLLAAASALGALALAAELPLMAYVARTGGGRMLAAALALRVFSLLGIGLRAVLAAARFRLVGEPHPDAGIEALNEVGVRVWPPPPARAHPIPVAEPSLISPSTGNARSV